MTAGLVRPLLCFAAVFACCLVLRGRFFPDRKPTARFFLAACLTALTAGLTALSFAFGNTPENEAAAAAWAFACIAVCLFGASLSDLKKRTVRDLFPCCLALCGLASFPLSGSPLWIRSSGALCAFLLFALINKLCGKRAIGGADLKLTAACFFAFGPETGMLGLLFGLPAAILSETVRKSKNKNKCSITEERPHVFPLVPYLTAGFLAANALTACARIFS